MSKSRQPVQPTAAQIEAYQLQAALLGQLAAARESLGLTQEELAQRAGVSRMTVQRAETPGAGTALSTVMCLARALNLIPSLSSADAAGGPLPPQSLTHRGLAYNRTKYEPEWRDRQRERALAQAWEAVNEHAPVGLSAIMPFLVPNASQAQATAAATVVQWLGSEVGFDFLTRALKQAGYVITDTKSEAVPTGKRRGAQPPIGTRDRTAAGYHRSLQRIKAKQHAAS